MESLSQSNIVVDVAIDKLEGDQAEAAAKALTSSAVVVDNLSATVYRAYQLKRDGAKGEVRTATWASWCASRAHAALEPWQLPNIKDPENRKAAQPFEVGAVLRGGLRNGDSVEAVTWIGIDFDGKESLVTLDDAARLAEVLRRLGIAHYVGESSTSKAEHRKFHVYIQVAPQTFTDVSGVPLRPSERRFVVESLWRPAYHAVASALRRLAGVSSPYDPAVAGDIARAWIVGRIPPDGEPRWNTYATGRAIDVIAASRALSTAGFSVPAALLRARSVKQSAGRKAGAALVETRTADQPMEGGYACLHAHRLDSTDLLRWARKRELSSLPDRGGEAKSAIPLGMQIYAIAKESGLLGPRLGPRSFLVLCPLRHEHSAGCPQRDRDEYHSSSALFLPDDVEDPETYVPPPPEEKKPVALVVQPSEEEAKFTDQLKKLESELATSAAGFIIPSLDNCCRILKMDPRWRGVIAWNLMSCGVEKLSAPPWSAHVVGSGEQVGAWNDKDDIRLCAWLSEAWAIEVSPSLCRQAVEVVAEASASFHAVQDYLNKLPAWDGTGRVDSWLVDLLGADDSEYIRKVGRWWLISAVARAMQPGSKVDTALVLEGPQGIFKSQAIARLAAGPSRRVYADTPIDFASKDRFEQIRGVWIYEVAELAGLDRHDAATLKAFISSPSDNYRRPYGRGATTALRCCVFVGTVNPEDGRGYLRDTTGNRRFWPVAVRRVDLKRIDEVRDQLWAEALHLFRANERWWPEGDAERKLCDAAAAERTASGDAWTQPIRDKLSEVYEADVEFGVAEFTEAGEGDLADFVGKPRTEITAATILEEWLGLTKAQQSRDATLRVSKVMAELGLTTRAQRFAGRVVKQYEFQNDAARRRLLAVIQLRGISGWQRDALRMLAISPKFPATNNIAGRALQDLREAGSEVVSEVEAVLSSVG